jgi:sarcosine oxidase subunit gamma
MTALGATAPRVASFGQLTLAEDVDVARASLALRKGAARPTPMGLTLPEPGGWVEAGALAAYWTGPDQWMIEAKGRALDDFAAELGAQAAGCSVTEQTDGFVSFEITSNSGPAPIERLLEKLVNVDLGTFAPGRATRTGFDHMAIFVIRRAENRAAVIGMRSAAGSLWHAIATAAARI